MELKVENGWGYVPAERFKKTETTSAHTIFLDAFFSPIRKVSYSIENTRVLDRSDFEKIILEIYTDGTIRPDEALIQTATILKEHMVPIIGLGKEPEFIEEEKFDKEREKLRQLLGSEIEELEISYRAYNCLKKEGIRTLGELVGRSEKEMLDIPNFGRKSLEELREVLNNLGLHFSYPVEGLVRKNETP